MDADASKKNTVHVADKRQLLEMHVCMGTHHKYVRDV